MLGGSSDIVHRATWIGPLGLRTLGYNSTFSCFSCFNIPPPTDYLSSRLIVRVGVGVVLYTFSSKDYDNHVTQKASQDAIGIEVADLCSLSARLL